ncbi:TonB-dependent receptor plug domain-containing protein [Campylobacter sp. CCUG 57310]|uniref:TonB-dependent receptor plug domain-containing protein n=1 Tax=Campylobacter sp. CCUG 57310 TaxID=2517362 RepID=UPI001567201A|nr:TonB-dependent receptor plug domain-containing protein [Campylobacter sp. CCUG 57310]QKF93117.1 TonB-dependent receptor [Campylobacter sp. CCUG 57310]
MKNSKPTIYTKLQFLAVGSSLCCLTIGVFAKDIELQDLNVTAKAPAKPITKNSKFQSGKILSKDSINSFAGPKKGLTDLLKTNPNVSFANNQSNAKNQGELDPQDISINGARFYQNSFTIDGISVNNDLNPAQRVSNQNNVEDVGSSGSRGMIGHPLPDIGSVSQGINLDPGLIETLNVHDSSVSAKFGGFQGGVIESKTRNPRKGFHGKISSAYTSDLMTKEIIDEQEKEAFNNSTKALYQPKFKKKKHTLELEGYLTEDFGLLFNYTRQNSIIPLIAYHENFAYFADGELKRNQTRQNENFFFKIKYFPTDELTITPTIIKAPSSAVYYDNTSKNSKQTFLSGGLIGSIDVGYEFDAGKFNQVFGYSNLTASKDAEHEYYRLPGSSLRERIPMPGRALQERVRVFKTDVNEGGYGDVTQEQKTLSYKADIELEKQLLLKLDNFDIEHTFSGGFEFKTTKAKYDVKEFNVYQSAYSKVGYNTKTGKFNEYITSCQDDEEACFIEDDVLTPINRNKVEKQRRGYFYTKKTQYKGKIETKVNEFSLYLQEEIQANNLTIRPGVRFETDTYTGDLRVAPRFATSLDIGDTTFSFGLNRYYGRVPYTFELKNNRETLATYYKKEGFNTDGSYNPDKYKFIIDEKEKNKKGRIYKKLKVPYDDEIALGISQDIDNYNIAFKYIRRKGRDQIFDSLALSEGFNRSDFEKNNNKNKYTDFTKLRIYTNKGKSKSDIYTFAVSNIKPIKLPNSLHKFELGFNYTKKRSNSFAYNSFVQGFTDVPKIYKPNVDYIPNYDYIKLNGKYIKLEDAPAEDFSRDWALMLSTISIFHQINMTVGNTFKIQAPLKRVYPVYVNKVDKNGKIKKEQETSLYNGHKVGSYETQKVSNPYFNWDIRIGFEFNMPKKSHFFINLDVLNVLSRKNKTGERNINEADGSLNAQYINTYESGRQYWIEGGYKW